MEKLIDYKVVKQETINKMRYWVMLLTSKGYELQGGLSCAYDAELNIIVYCQAMVKYEEVADDYKVVPNE